MRGVPRIRPLSSLGCVGGSPVLEGRRGSLQGGVLTLGAGPRLSGGSEEMGKWLFVFVSCLRVPPGWGPGPRLPT